MKNMNIIPLFPTIVTSDFIGREFTKDELNCIEYHSKKIKLKCGNRQSIETYVLDNFLMSDLKNICLKYLNFYLKEIYKAKNDVEIYLTQSWINYSNYNEWHEAHKHPNSFLSGVIYFNTNDNDSIIFYDDKYLNIECEPTIYTLENAKSWWLPVSKGFILIFPSSLCHKVPKTSGKNERISLAFNSFIKGNLGCNESLTELKLC